MAAGAWPSKLCFPSRLPLARSLLSRAGGRGRLGDSSFRRASSALDGFLHYSNALPVFHVRPSAMPPSLFPSFMRICLAGTIWRQLFRVYITAFRRRNKPDARSWQELRRGGAIDYDRTETRASERISGHNSYFYWGPRGYTGECAIIFGERATELSKLFGDVPGRLPPLPMYTPWL